MLNTNLSSDVPSIPNTKSENPGRNVISTKRLGDLAEQWITMLAAWKGCEVFRNANTTGSTDIVLSHPERGLLEIDVKCMTYSIKRSEWGNNHTGQVACPKTPVSVLPVGDFADWKVSWVKGRIPHGWEDFWANDQRIYSTTCTRPTE